MKPLDITQNQAKEPLENFNGISHFKEINPYLTKRLDIFSQNELTSQPIREKSRQNQLLVNSIYYAFEGEGIFVGQGQVFLRLQGCDIGCVNCDSRETWLFQSDLEIGEGQKTQWLDFSLVLEKILQVSGGDQFEAMEIPSVPKQTLRLSISGGDPTAPFHEKSLLSFLEILKKHALVKNRFHNLWTHLEVTGTRFVPELFSSVDFLSVDIKPPSTGVKWNKIVLKKIIENYGKTLQLKSPTTDREDLEKLLELRLEWDDFISPLEKSRGETIWVITPAFNPGEDLEKFVERSQKILEWNQFYGGFFRVILQQHKIFYPNRSQFH